ncbi:MAG: hypothetical protein KDE56_27120 [Anaerolineales bacterium]|nr:hypothetical protein [Anaerolineales bacterium]
MTSREAFRGAAPQLAALLRQHQGLDGADWCKVNRWPIPRAVSPVRHPPTGFTVNTGARRPGEDASRVANVTPGHPAPTIIMCYLPTEFTGNTRARRPGEDADRVANVTPGHPAPTIIMCETACVMVGQNDLI